MLSLLPEVEQDPVVAASARQLATQAERRLVFLLHAPPSEMDAVSDRFERYLSSTGHFDAGDDPMLGMESLFEYRYQLLTKDQLDALRQMPDALVDQALASLYSAFGAVQASMLMQDPVGLHLGYMSSLTPAIELINSRTPLFEAGDRQWALHSMRLATSGFDLGDPLRLQRLIDEIRAWAKDNQAALLVTGLPMFAASGSASAFTEIRLFGTVSVAVVVILLIGVFRSARPLLLTITSIASGIGAAFAITIILFGQVHILTLVFGSSLIGISVDYAMHYLCRWFDPSWSRETAMAEVLPGISLGLVSSVAAFASLLITPFPGLRQIAVFSATGLGCAFMTVVCLMPVLVRRDAAHRTPWLMALGSTYIARWPFMPRRAAQVFLLCVCVVVIFGIARLQPNDDVRLLQSAPQSLLDEDAQVRALLPGQFDSQFVLVKGADQAEVWKREAHLIEALLGAGLVDEVRALSSEYPSAAVQYRNYETVEQTLYTSGRIEALYRQIGIPDGDIDAHVADFQAHADRTVSLTQWLQGVPADLRNQWLGCDTMGCASIVRLRNIQKPQEIRALTDSIAGVRYVDQVEDLSALLGRYREVATLLLVGVYIAIGLVLVWRIGLRAAIGVVAVPMMATLIAIASVHFSGNLFSLFNLFALLLVVGISIDYAIFFHLRGASDATTILAITLSAITTLAAFGMLSASSTEVVHAFGQTLLVGIAAAFLLAPLASADIRKAMFRTSGAST